MHVRSLALVQQRRLAGERGIEVAIGEEVAEDLARDAVDFLLRHAERLGRRRGAPGAARNAG